MWKQAGSRGKEAGAAFFVVLLLVISSTALVGAYLASSLSRARHVEQQVAELAAFNAAESGLNAIVETVWARYIQAPPADRFSAIVDIDGDVDPAHKIELVDRSLGLSSFTAEVRDVRIVGHLYADVEIAATGRSETATRTVMAVVRYGRSQSQVFNHAYFINNFGWLWGAGIRVNGSVRSNGNFSVRSSTVNGDITGSENPEIGAVGTVTGTSYHDTLEAYNATYGDRSRPTDPSAPSEDLNGNGQLDAGEDANANGVLDVYEYTGGYDGDSERHEREPLQPMPYLGDLAIYRDLAALRGGTISQGGTILVDGVLGDDVAERKRIILVGTESNPIEVNGPVVVESDVVIKGYVTGRGTIYAGRNIHIVGDLKYKNPPSWPKPLTDLDTVAAENETKDAIGLAAKGSIVLGDYTVAEWKATTKNYQRPGFTQPYVVDPTDEPNGYVSYYDGEGRPVFDGDYTARDGGVKDDASSRRYFESSFTDAVIHGIADPGLLSRVDAILYTNHLLTGRIGGCTFNGSLVSRDEAILYTSGIEMNYDPRMRDGGYEQIDIYLPREPTYRILYWNEGTP